MSATLRPRIRPVDPSSKATLLTMLACLTLLVFTLSRPITAQSSGAAPLIDRELFFGDPEISGAQISPDGQFIAFIKPYKGTRNVWVKRTAEPFDRAKPITADTSRPIRQYFGVAMASTYSSRKTKVATKISMSMQSNLLKARPTDGMCRQLAT